MWPSKSRRLFLCVVDFGFRTDSYVLCCGRDSWYLWHQYFGDYTERHVWGIVACTPRDGISENDAAAKLLHAIWDYDSDTGGGPDVTPGDVLSVAELRAIAAWTYGRKGRARIPLLT